MGRTITSFLLCLALLSASTGHAAGPSELARTQAAPSRTRVGSALGRVRDWLLTPHGKADANDIEPQSKPGLFAHVPSGKVTRLQTALLVANVGLAAVTLARQVHAARKGGLATAGKNAAAFLAGYELAEAGGHVGHQLLDEYFTERDDSPGPMAREFQLHHSDPTYITKSRWADNAYPVSLFTGPAMAGIAAMKPGPKQAMLLGVAMGVFLTSTSHKASHMPASELGPLARFAQKVRVLLPREEHATHHTAEAEHPYSQDYGVLNGTSNKLFATLGVNRALAQNIYDLTGEVPNSWLQPGGVALMKQDLGERESYPDLDTIRASRHARLDLADSKKGE